MIITREKGNGHSRYTLDGEKISKGELEAHCGKYLSGYGLRSMFNRLANQRKLIVEVDGGYVCGGVREMHITEELADAKKRIAELEEKLTAIKNCVS